MMKNKEILGAQRKCIAMMKIIEHIGDDKGILHFQRYIRTGGWGLCGTLSFSLSPRC